MASKSQLQQQQYSRQHRCVKRRFGKRCLGMVKQQKTRFYILGRCVCMLLCWHAHALPD